MKVIVAVKKAQLSTLTTVYPIFSSTVHSLLFLNIFLIIFFNFCFHFSLTLRSPPTPTHCTTTKKKHPPHQSSTSILHHSTTGSAPFNHRTHDVDPPTARATEPPIYTDQDRSTGKKAQLNHQKKKSHRTTKISRRVEDLAGLGGIHLQLH
jgi:hypothetical protein